MHRTAIAGIGNIFLGDDAFGPAVIDALREAAPDGIELIDAGIRGFHLALDLADRVDALVLVDAAELRAAPGTLALIEPTVPAPGTVTSDGHSIDVGAVLAHLQSMSTRPPRVLVVGCQPAQLEPTTLLSEVVAAAVEPAARLAAAVAMALAANPADPLDGIEQSPTNNHQIPVT